MPVTKAVIPAAGLGTRFLPATKAQPKEMLPVIDKPAVQYIVEEAVRAGLTDVLVVTSRGKQSIEDHLDRSLELEQLLLEKGKEQELEEIRKIAELAKVHFVRQSEPLGFGHAVLMAREHVGDNAFAVMVGDEIVPEPMGSESPLLPRMIEIHERTGGSVLAVQEVEKEDIAGYGIVDPENLEGDTARVRDMIEKPAPEDAPSNLAARGRYILTPDIFDAIESTPPGVGDEIQLTDAIRQLAHEGRVYAYVHDGPILDVGKKLEYLQTTIELALRRPDLSEPLRSFLEQVVRRDR